MLAWLAAASSSSAASAGAAAWMPEDWRELPRTISLEETAELLGALDGVGPVTVSVAGRSAGGRPIHLVRLSHGGEPVWRVLLYAQQHGDEVSGKDALLYLIREIARAPERLAADTEVWFVPSMNPDGAAANTRVNGAGADLNRDHLALEQPETRLLHELALRFRPDVAVDCHEFARDPGSWRERGWEKWPDITTDGLNNPLFDPALVAAADRWVAESAGAEAAAGHPFLRYWVGGVPPEAEQRHSAPDIDSAMNALGAYGGLSFIVEAAARATPAAGELGSRVDAYLVLLRRFVAGGERRAEDLAAIAGARGRPLPPFLPVNYLWVNPGGDVTRFPVRELATGATREVPTPNLMTRLATKRSVTAPVGYAVTPAAAPAFATLLERHGIPFATLARTWSVSAESCRLERIEAEFDELYSRYEGRQIVSREPAALRELPAGSLWVPLAGESAVRAALLLEPLSLYGLYQVPSFRALVGVDGTVPVLRVTAYEGGP